MPPKIAYLVTVFHPDLGERTMELHARSPEHAREMGVKLYEHLKDPVTVTECRRRGNPPDPEFRDTYLQGQIDSLKTTVDTQQVTLDKLLKIVHQLELDNKQLYSEIARVRTYCGVYEP